MTESGNAQTARAAMQAMSDFNFDAVESLVTDDIVVIQPFPAMGMPHTMHGKEQFIGGVRFVPTMFKEFRLTITDLYDCPEDESVVFEQRSRGIFNVDGSEYENQYIMIFEFRGGLICSWTECYDSLIMTEKMTPVMAKMAS